MEKTAVHLMTPSKLINQMNNQILVWESRSDQRSIFLNCYQMMTTNMFFAIDRHEFKDPPWVGVLLYRFAEYYFIALDAYDENPVSAPKVWQLAHQYRLDNKTWALQKLLLGVNAHINYDLVLTLADLLKPVWDSLSTKQQADRHSDFLFVNQVIAQTIDSVQDEIIEPAIPLMEIVDSLLLRGDEVMISHLLTKWRDQVWEHGRELLHAKTIREQKNIVKQVEKQALYYASMILLSDVDKL
jgi:hypothetical protein